MLLRSVVLSYGGSHGLLKDVIAEATRQFHAHREDEQVHASLVSRRFFLSSAFALDHE